MNTHDVRVMVIKDTETKEEVYGQLIHDDYHSSPDGSVPSTASVVRSYLAEFCSDCFIRNNKVDLIDDSFTGIAAVVSEEIGMKEYNIVVRKLSRPMDNMEILEYHNKEFREWNAARELHRGNADPRPMQGPIQDDPKSEVFWKTFWFVFKLVSLAVVLMFVFHSLVHNSDSEEM